MCSAATQLQRELRWFRPRLKHLVLTQPAGLGWRSHRGGLHGTLGRSSRQAIRHVPGQHVGRNGSNAGADHDFVSHWLGAKSVHRKAGALGTGLPRRASARLGQLCEGEASPCRGVRRSMEDRPPGRRGARADGDWPRPRRAISPDWDRLAGRRLKLSKAMVGFRWTAMSFTSQLSCQPPRRNEIWPAVHCRPRSVPWTTLRQGWAAPVAQPVDKKCHPAASWGTACVSRVAAGPGRRPPPPAPRRHPAAGGDGPARK